MKNAYEKLQRLSRSIHYSLGIEDALYPKRDNCDKIIMYHNVLPKLQTNVHIRHISSHDFRDQLRYFKKKYSLVTLDQMYNEPALGRRMAITFDDGVVNNLHHALPIIESEKVPVTFFITTSWLRGISSLWPDVLSILLSKENRQVIFRKEVFRRVSVFHFRSELTGKLIQHSLLESDKEAIEEFIQSLILRLNFNPSFLSEYDDWCRVMRGEELAIMIKCPYVALGSHGISHHNFIRLTEDELREELAESKMYLEKITKQEIKALAFPFGKYNAKVLQEATMAGYSQLLAVDLLASEDATKDSLKGRLGLYSDRSSLEQLHQVNSMG